MMDLSTLRRPTSPNTALRADPGDTPSKSDGPAVRLPYPPAAVIMAWDAVVKAAPRTEVLLSDPERGRHHAVQRSRLLRFPDDVYAEARPSGDGGTRLLLYSASRYGRSDFGVNRKRLETWTRALEAALPPR